MQDQSQKAFRRKLPIPLISLFTMEMTMGIFGLLIMIVGLVIPAFQFLILFFFGGWPSFTTKKLFSRILPYESCVWLEGEGVLRQILSHITEDMSLFVFVETVGMILVFLDGILAESTRAVKEKYARLNSNAS